MVWCCDSGAHTNSPVQNLDIYLHWNLCMHEDIALQPAVGMCAESYTRRLINATAWLIYARIRDIISIEIRNANKSFYSSYSFVYNTVCCTRSQHCRHEVRINLRIYNNNNGYLYRNRCEPHDGEGTRRRLEQCRKPQLRKFNLFHRWNHCVAKCQSE